MGLAINLVDDVDAADLLMIPKNQYHKNPRAIEIAEASKIPVYVLRSNTISQIERSLADIYHLRQPPDRISAALEETEEAINAVKDGSQSLHLNPQNSFIRRLQHQLVETYDLKSESTGKEPRRRLRVFKGL